MRRIAVFTHGGVALPSSPMEIPAIAGLVRRLSENFDITVYTVVKPDGYSRSFNCGRATVQFVQSRLGSASPIMAARMIQEFLRDHRIQPYVLVHGFWSVPGGLTADLAGWVASVPSVVTLLGGETADVPSIRYGNLSHPLSKQATLWTCRNATVLTVLTEFQRAGLDRTRVNRETLAIPFGAEPEFYRPSTEYPDLMPPLRILHVGSLNAVKDQRTLLLAFRRVASTIDSRLTVVGGDTLHGRIQALARELGIADRVRFTGYLPHAQVRDYLFQAHILLHSSLYEGQGLVFAEAASAGVPICGTRVGLLSDLGNSFAQIAEPGDHEGLAAGVLRIASDPVLRSRLRSWAFSWARTHGADWTATQFTDVYESAMSQHQRQSPDVYEGPLNVRQSAMQ